jgi:hypothetical protein
MIYEVFTIQGGAGFRNHPQYHEDSIGVDNIMLVGALVHFSIYWEFHHPT